MGTTGKIKVILNPNAGRKAGQRLEPKIRQALAVHNVSYDLVHTTGTNHAIELAHQAKLDGFELVVAAGGDGTISEVVNGLALAAGETGPVGTLGVIPVGTGNDFADMGGIPRNLDAAVGVIMAGRTQLVDLGQIHIQGEGKDERRTFNNNLGCGFEAQVTVESRKIKRLQGTAVYLTAVLKAMISYRQPHIDVTWTDETGQSHQATKEMLMISIGNSRRTGGGFYVTPNALLDDGLYDMALANALSRGRIMVLLPKVMMGTHTGDPAVTFVQATHIRIASPSILPVHADGEMISYNADILDITLQPKRLVVLTPGFLKK